MQPIDILQKHFGYAAFRDRQEEIIQHTLAKKDTLVLMPTGGGKSLCFQVPALLMNGVTVVISPLIALMKDQVDALKENGIAAAYLNSSMHESDQRSVIAKLRNKELKLLYLAPERLMGNTNAFLEFLKGLEVSLFAIDEAHCISQWGHDFRPEYLMLAELKRKFPEVPVIALTASADEVTRKDIAEKLALKSPELFVSSFNRPNIYYFIEQKRDTFGSIVRYLTQRKEESGIIYALSRASCEQLAGDLREEGFSAKHYHAGLEPRERANVQEEFSRDEIKIIVATIAFGMGIDKSNVRFVIHHDVPKNIESYYQETGRAGRDGVRSDAILYYSKGDILKLKKFAQVEGNTAQTEIMLRKLDEIRRFCEASRCRRKMLLNYFGEEAEELCNSCDYCLSQSQKFDATTIAQKALSAVSRTSERYGLKFLVDFLRGAKNEKIKEHHRTIKTYGIGKDLSAQDWMIHFNELIAKDYLEVDRSSSYPIVKLTSQSWKVLKGEEKVFLTPINSSPEQQTQEPAGYEKELFQELRQERFKLSNELNIPPYIILSDATLMDLAMYLPHSKEEIRKISGFGDLKTERYADRFLKVLMNYCRLHNLSSRMLQKRHKRERKTQRSSASSKESTRVITFQLYQSGKTEEEIATLRQLSVFTIMSHLADYVRTGELAADTFVSQDRLQKILPVVQQLGTLRMGDIKRALGDEYNYGEINIVAGFYDWTQANNL